MESFALFAWMKGGAGVTMTMPFSLVAGWRSTIRSTTDIVAGADEVNLCT
jgi:hypothetical protein